MSKLSICIVSPGLSGGGAEDIAIKSANFYFKKNYRVVFVTFKKQGILKKRIISGIKIIYVKMKNIFSFSFEERIKKYKFNHTISFIRHCNIATFFARKFGNLNTEKLHLIEVNTFDQQKELNFFKRLLQNLLLKVTYSFSEDVIAVSNLVKNEIIKKFNISKNLRVVGNPSVSLKSIKKTKKKIKQNLGYVKYVSAGRLHPQKDFLFLLRVFKDFKKIHKSNLDTLTIYGIGPEYKKIKKFIKKNKLSKFVFMKGFVDNLVQKLTNYDAFVLTSKYEGFGNVIIMAMHAGLPVIAKKNTGGPDDLINSKNGKLFKNDIELLHILKSFKNNNFQSSELKKITKRYTEDIICMKYLKI